MWVLPLIRDGATMHAVTSEEVLDVADPVERAGLADELMWTAHPQRSRLRMIRADAIRQALDDGRLPDDVAKRLKVKVDDIGWMADRPVERPGAARGR